MARRLLVTLALVASAVSLFGCAEEAPGASGPTSAPPSPETAAGPVPATGAADGPAGTCAPDDKPDAGSPDGPPKGPPDGMPEVQGVADSGNSFWGLLFPRGEGPGLHAGREEKIVWRMTGSGTFSIRATGPGGATIEPAWGPVEHGGSTWSRPGDEWGTGWNFPAAGCWTVQASRSGGATGVLTLRIS